MKRLTLLIIALMCFCVANAKHLEFMGIPITGTINSFQDKLAAKGVAVSDENNNLPAGVRGFYGNYVSLDCDILAFYNTQNKQVYRVAAIADCGSDIDVAVSVFEYYKHMLNMKYEDASLNSDMLEDEEDYDEFEYSMVIFDPPIQEGSQALGTIIIKIIQLDDDLQSYGVCIIYEDYEGSELNNQTIIDSL